MSGGSNAGSSKARNSFKEYTMESLILAQDER